MEVKDAGALPPFGVGGWMVFTSSRFVFDPAIVELKFELATGAPEAVNEVVFLLCACAIWSELSHQNCASPASTCTLPKCIAGLICPPNIQPSSLFEISLKVHWRPWIFT